MILDFETTLQYMPLIFNGIKVTLLFTFFSMISGFVLGTLLTLVKVSGKKIPKMIADGYTSVFRGTPLLVQLFLVYYATPQLTGYSITALEAAVLTFGLNASAYISEIMRGGIMSVDKGQREAAMSLGIPYKLMMSKIVFPQALRMFLPSLVNEAIGLLKNSSLVAMIGVTDIMRGAQMMQNITYRAFEPYLIAAATYYVLVAILTVIANNLERRVRKSDQN